MTPRPALSARELDRVQKALRAIDGYLTVNVGAALKIRDELTRLLARLERSERR